VARYLAAMVEKDSTYLQNKAGTGAKRTSAEPVRAPEVVETIPTSTTVTAMAAPKCWASRFWTSRAGRFTCSTPGLTSWFASGVRAKEEVPLPMVGFMLRNQLGMDFSGTNTAREGHDAGAHATRRHLYGGFLSRAAGAVIRHRFSFSPAVADGTLLGYRMCDWIDNAVVLQMGRSRPRSTVTFISPAAWKSTPA